MVKLILTKIRRSIIPCILVLFVITATHSLEAQNQVSVGFTATMQEDTWIALDSVNITNQSRSWTETIYYPDTTLQMINSVGIEEAESQNLQLFQNSPNPFNGTTEVQLHIPYKDNITMVLYDISGKQCAVYDATVEGGLHAFTINVVAAQMYLLKVHTSRGSRSIKMLSTGTGGSYGIKPRAMHPQIIQKSFTDHEFQSNDSMVYTGYATYKGEPRTQTLSFLQTGNDTTLCFDFPLPEYKTLRFTAQLDSVYYPLDSIRITNLSSYWTEMLFYSDTTLQFILSQQKNISNHKIEQFDNLYFEAYFTYNGTSKTKNKYAVYEGKDTTYVFELDSSLLWIQQIFFRYPQMLNLDQCLPDTVVVRIATEEERQYINNCLGDTLPTIDFQNQTILLVHGHSYNGINTITSDLIQTASNKYSINIIIDCFITHVVEPWIVAFILSPKLSTTDDVLLDVQITY